MKKLLTTFLITAILVVSFNSLSQDKKYQVTCVGFYNLENLFDTIVDPDTTKILQEEFTPHGSYTWGTYKYFNKLENMAKVISEIGTDATPDGAAVLGVSEIENRQVLEDLIKEPALKDRNYKIAHIESPDIRGIDVGLLYQEKYFKIKHTASYTVSLPDNPYYRTRNQLVVTGEMSGEDVTIIVAHWPSRRGGQKASAYKRNAAGALGRRIVDSLFIDNPTAKIIVMGDLNDDPVDPSVKEYLFAGGKINKLAENELYNPFWAHFKKGDCTLAYRDAWNLFDQVIISQSFLNEDQDGYIFHNSYVFRRDYLFQKEGRFAGYPLRTHAGGEYMNGYSDHLPAYIILKKEVK